MSGTVGIVIFVVSILLVILIHEAAHFGVAKAFGIKVEEFFVGFGPRLYSRQKGETEYGVKAFPLGGYVKIAGMNPYEEISPEDYPRTYPAKPAWQRASVIVAGPMTHFVIAFLLFAAFFAFFGQHKVVAPKIAAVDNRVAGQVAPAKLAGLKVGDEVVRIDGIVNPTRKQFMLYIRNHPNESIPIVVDRNGQRVATTVTPIPSLNYHFARIGIQSDAGRVLLSQSRGVFGSIAAAGSQIAEVTKQTVLSLGKVFGPQGIGRMFDLVFGNAQRSTGDAVGSVGVASAAGQITQAFGFGALLFLLAGVNVFVGILNLLPIPPFDGGHLAVVAWEKIRGKKVDARKLVPVTMVVVVFLMIWFVGITYLDIFKPVHVVP
ncbi:MAG TPA: M50 family metallopeptidase [Actinomycetota bacterium]|nr:M50 family metallopeptidase [Actinomycetota bacterium]